jgi:hypothetical protein
VVGSLARAKQIADALLSLVVALAIVGAAVVARGAPSIHAQSGEASNAGAEGLTAVNRMAAAAAFLDAAIGPYGSGYHFSSIQRTTEYAKADGPAIAVVDPADPRSVVGTTTELFVNAMTTRGFVTGDGFFMEMHLGSNDSTMADLEAGPKTFSVIAKGSQLWRDDGQGWYQTDASPGMGIDPISARLLPAALANVKGLSLVGPELLDGRSATRLDATFASADYPGAIAADGKDFTEPSFPVRVWLDDQDRVVQLVLTARNLNQTLYDLVAETTITFDYGPPGEIPAPVPTMAPEPSPSDAAPFTSN